MRHCLRCLLKFTKLKAKHTNNSCGSETSVMVRLNSWHILHLQFRGSIFRRCMCQKMWPFLFCTTTFIFWHWQVCQSQSTHLTLFLPLSLWACSCHKCKSLWVEIRKGFRHRARVRLVRFWPLMYVCIWNNVHVKVYESGLNGWNDDCAGLVLPCQPPHWDVRNVFSHGWAVC